jgi:hypothetical protein
MALFFISYRTDAGAPHAGRLFDRLAAHFGQGLIFYDRGNLQPGQIWKSRLQDELKEAIAVLALIDPGWVLSFARRANDDDILRFELETAIQLHKTLIPILVGGGENPKKADLLPSLRAVLDRQLLLLEDITTTGYSSSIDALIDVLENLEGYSDVLEPQICGLIISGSYSEALRLIMRLPATSRKRSTISVYIALAKLAGRSFNAIYPAERETIEALLRRAHAASPSWQLPLLLLAIFEIDFYQLHGLVSRLPVRPADVFRINPPGVIEGIARQLLGSFHISKRARNALSLGSELQGEPDA